MKVPEIRLLTLNDADVRTSGDYVLYWMIAARRTTWNFALEHAVDRCKRLEKPLFVFEPLRTGYPWASLRHHRFIVNGMFDNARACEKAGVTYYPYLEPEEGAGKGLLAALAERAALVVTDYFPSFMYPRMTGAAAEQVECLMEAVDGNGLLPLDAAEKRVFPTAYAFRRFLQKTLPEHLDRLPVQEPLRSYDQGPALTPRAVSSGWPSASTELLEHGADLSDVPVDSSVAPVAAPGGSREAGTRLNAFLRNGLPRYAEDGNDLDDPATSGLSPYFHFGHLAAHEVFHAVSREEGWEPAGLSKKTDGKRRGWWGMSENAEAFLDQLVTWRELGYNMAHYRPDHETYGALPAWARETLEDHAGDTRDPKYSLKQFEAAETHDELWNAAQRQLLQEGVIHNYLRMLWGKKILHWSKSPRAALDIMLELNNKYAIDGRDPNSTSGIFWVLGRYDRAWGPEREIFGKIRYMTSANTARKLKVKGYLERYGG